MEDCKIIYANNLEKHDITRHKLRTMVAEGKLSRITHGIYAEPSQKINQIWLIGERYKNGVYSHNVALYLHGIIEKKPIVLDMTFPSNNRLKNEFLKVHYVKKENHKLGLVNMNLEDGFEVQVYNLERTICDIIRDRNKLQVQVLSNTLKEYVKRKDKDLKLMYEYAKIFNIEKILERYMEILI